MVRGACVKNEGNALSPMEQNHGTTPGRFTIPSGKLQGSDLSSIVREFKQDLEWNGARWHED